MILRSRHALAFHINALRKLILRLNENLTPAARANTQSVIATYQRMYVE